MTENLDQERRILIDSGGKEVKAEYIRIRVKSTHLTGSRYRGGIRFVNDKDTILNVSLLSDAQIKAINNDVYLVVKSAEKPTERAENEPETDDEDESDE